MNDQALRQLLIDADASAGPMPATSCDLATSVQRRLRLRRQAQMAIASVLMCAIFVVTPMIRMNSGPARVANSSQAKAELALIRIQADSQAATVNRMVQYQKSLDVRTAAARKVERGQPLERLQQQRERAARSLTQDGEYRRVIELFPETKCASIARQRLQT